ncbi:MAG: acylaminoacyl-peptidase [Arenicella sp.]|jgi:acylaminoacyl-peptidase
MLIKNLTFSALVAISPLLSLAAIGADLAVSSQVIDEPAESNRKFTSERIFDLEYAASPQISPDGKTIIYTRRSMDKFSDRVVSDLWTLDTRSGAHRPLISGQGASSSVRWSPSGDRLIYLTSIDGKPSLRVRYQDTGDSFAVAQLEHSPSAPVWSPDGKSIAFSMLVRSQAPTFATPISAPDNAEWSDPVRVFNDLTIRFDGAGYLKPGIEQVFIVSAEGGTPRQVTFGDNDFSSPAWLSNGYLVVEGNDVESPELDPIESDLYKVKLSDLSISALTTRDGPDHSAMIAPDQSLIAYRGYTDQLKAYQQTDLYLMKADGSNIKNLTEKYDHPIESMQWLPSSRGLVAQSLVEGMINLVMIDLSGKVKVLVSDIGGTSFGRPYASGSFSLASGVGGNTPTIAYTKGSPDRPAEIAYQQGYGDSRVLTDLNADVLPYLDMAKIEEITVKSRHDGRDIEAWIALPHGFEATASSPLLLEIHGGPFAMYGPYFAAEIQRYAAEGYVTVYVNPRGSTGYGEEFSQLIDKAYPGNDHEDLMTVVDELIKKQYVDQGRLFITGGSGGGVLTAWAVGKTNRFAAAATIKPVINWTTMALAADISRFVSRHWLGAQPWENPELYWRLSPISLVGNVKTPTLVMVGEEDWRTPAWEAEQFYTALKVQKVDSALVRIPGASHSIASRPSRLIAKVDNILGWFAKYDPENSLTEE